MSRSAHVRLGFWAVLTLLSVRAVSAQDPERQLGPTGAMNYANTRWAMQVPDRDSTDACVAGFWTFQFSPTGWFVYNNKVRGSYRVDELGNVRLKTREGQMLTLIFNGITLRPAQTVSFVRRNNIFQRCGE